MIGSSLGKRAATALAATCVAMSLAGCGGGKALGLRTEFVPFTQEQRTELESNRSRAYRIQEGDVLKIQFAYEKPLDQEGVIVLPDGAVTLVGIDTVRLAGLTIVEADSVLTAAYSKEYREPALSVMVQNTLGRRVYVMGEVTDPGIYTVPAGGMDVMSAIVVASGFTDDAAPDGTVIVRVTPTGYQFQEVDLGSFAKGKFAAAAIVPLQPYDIVYVPRSRSGDFAYFTRSVLSGLGGITRMAYDVANIVNKTWGGY